VANADSEFGIITGNLSNRKNVPQKMRRYSEYGGESSGNNSRVTCILMITIYNATFIDIEACPRTLRTALVRGGLNRLPGQLIFRKSIITMGTSESYSGPSSGNSRGKTIIIKI
jgi:hypothetical protein